MSPKKKRRSHFSDTLSPLETGSLGNSSTARDEMRREFPGDTRLDSNTLFSLPPSLLVAIRKFVPKLLTDADVGFEYRLRELTGTGLFGSDAKGLDLLDDPADGDVSPELFGDVRQQISREVEMEFHVLTTPPDNRKKLVEDREMIRSRSHERRQSFAGWLICNIQFRQEVAELAAEWDQWPFLAGCFPNLSRLSSHMYPLRRGADLKAMSLLLGSARNLLQKWNLTGMATWDLPLPIAPVQTSSEELPTNEKQSMGASIFIPWWMHSDQDLKVQEVIGYHRSRRDLTHLDGWTFSSRKNDSSQKNDSGQKNVSKRKNDVGRTRYAKLLQMYIYFMRGIRVRYPDRLHGKLGFIDRAFAVYWNPKCPDEDALKADTDSVRKIREDLQKKQAEIDETMGTPHTS